MPGDFLEQVALSWSERMLLLVVGGTGEGAWAQGLPEEEGGWLRAQIQVLWEGVGF